MSDTHNDTHNDTYNDTHNDNDNDNDKESNPIFEDDAEKPHPDPEVVLAKELMNLSMKDRSQIQEEIHGVHCSAPAETPEFLRECLQKLHQELENNTTMQIEERQGYIESQQEFAKKGIYTFVNTDEFRLRFLRCELFDIPCAARRIFYYLGLVRQLFGKFALQRPIRITDFSREELKFLRKGRYQLLPYRDRAGPYGRRILVFLPDGTWEKTHELIRTKVWIYMTYVCGEDIETQRSGISVLVWCDENWKNIAKQPFYCDCYDRFFVNGTRISSVHICTPNTGLFRFRRYMMVKLIGDHKRRVMTHFGANIELRYELRGFGIPIDFLPVSFSGTIKEKYAKEWVRMRTMIESKNYPKSIIECPYLDDVLFRKGTSLSSHPANAFLRRMIVEKCNLAHKKKSANDIAEEIFNQLRNEPKIRFLVWCEEAEQKDGYWKEVRAEHQQSEILKKVIRLTRDIRNVLNKEQQQEADGIIQQGDNKRQRLSGDTRTEGQRIVDVDCLGEAFRYYRHIKKY